MATVEYPQSAPFGGPFREWTVVRLVIAVVGVAYVGYLALLMTCDLLRVALPFVPQFGANDVFIAQLQPDSIAARAGLQAGDRLRRANGQSLEGAADWQRVRVHLDPTKPLVLEIERAGQPLIVSLLLPSGLSQWRSGSPRPALLAFRLAQVITLAFAVVVAFKRYAQPSALLGAVLLASLATVSLALPMRLVAFWHALPVPFGALLWIPFATSVAVGPLLFAFFVVFPRRLWSTTALAVSLIPGCLMVGWHVHAWHRIMEDPGPPTGLTYRLLGVFAINVVYAAGAVALLVVHTRTAVTPTDKRRIRVLITGAIAGVGAGAAVVVGYWRHPGADIFASRTLTVLSLVFLAVPASFAYAILRHRLFDVSLIVRQGLRYALARGFVDALIPALGSVLLIDVLVHRDQPLLTMLRSRWWWFTVVAAALLIVRARRERWLNSVDRKFFRERYNAQRLLSTIVENITRAPSFDSIAPTVMQRIEEALHPESVSVLSYSRTESKFVVVPANTAPDKHRPLPSSMKVVRVLSALRKPLALSSVQYQLPPEERALLVSQGIDLLVPISSQPSDDPPLGLLVLGPRRSEEPYNQEDLDLLMTIADAVSLLLERSAHDERTFAECEHCGRCFQPSLMVCPNDDQRLMVVRGSRLLKERYRLERRLGRGGMGDVYAAVDNLLERPVAVKLIRENALGPLDLTSRFYIEGRVAARLVHPNIVRVYDFGVDVQQRPFLVMELLEGETLRQRLGSSVPLSPRETLHILRGICAALSFAHGQGLVHRDLKPENIFLERHAGGVVPKVLDFGLAKTFSDQPSFERATDSEGLLVGTLDYMGPEQVVGDDVSPEWDVWALGVIAFEMLTTRLPFQRRIAPEVEETLSDLAVIDGRRSPELSEAIVSFFQSALAPERAVRPTGALDFLQAYEQAVL